MNANGEELLTIPEAARVLRVKESTVRLLLMRDQLKAVRTGAFEVKLRRADLRALGRSRGARR
jgi:excisionase family DNA binding protein